MARPFARKFTDEQRDQALAAYKRAGAAQAARELPFEIAPSTIRKIAQRSGASAPKVARTEAATKAAKLSREALSEKMAADALDTAAGLLARVAEANPSNARLLAGAFDLTLRGSQLLSGGATERIELSGEERVQRVRELRDELAGKREAKRASAR
ncbi:MAG: hypothetical protein AABM42_01880 [Actinomycetota bacterium]